MKRLTGVSVLGAALTLSTAVLAQAQTPDASAAASPEARTRRGRRRPTVSGDTGLWFVPTAEVLPEEMVRLASTARTSTTARASPTSRLSRSRSACGLGEPRGVFGSWIAGHAHRPRHAAALLHEHGRREQSRHRRRHPGRLPVRPRRRGPATSCGDLWVGGKFNLLGRLEGARWRSPRAHGQAAVGDKNARRVDRQGRLPVRRHRVDRQPRRRGLGLRRRDRPRQPGRLHADERLPLGLRRGLPAALQPAASGHGRALRRALLQQHDHRPGRPARRRTARSCRRSTGQEPGRSSLRPDVAGAERLLRRRRHELEPAR